MPTIAQPGDVVLATHRDDVTIVGIFSSSPHPSRQTWMVLSNRDPAFAETGLKTTSVIKAERIAVIEKSIVVRKLGSLSTSQMQEVKRAVKLAIEYPAHRRAVLVGEDGPAPRGHRARDGFLPPSVCHELRRRN